MEFEVRFNGSPDHLLEVIDLFTVRRLKKGDIFRWAYDRDGLNFYNLWDVKQKENSGAFIKAQNLPDSKALLIVYFPDDKWSELQKYWVLLNKEMLRQGWIHTPVDEEVEKISKDLEKIRSTLPKTPLGMKRWKNAYAVIKKIRKLYEMEYNDGIADTPTPTIDDLREALQPIYKRIPSDRTVEKIIAAGDNGFLD
jgi:hypothetical protein